MPNFVNALGAWGSDAFATALQREVEALPPGVLTLQDACRSGYVDDSDITASVMSVTESAASIEAHVGVFFQELLPGCSCGEDPPAESAYCEIRVTIDKATAETEFVVIPC